MASDSAPLPPPPEPPDPMECCGRGCYPCIFDYYDKAIERWKARIIALGGDPEAMLKAQNLTSPAQRREGDHGPSEA